MAFGLWKKIKRGLSKVVGGIGKAFKWVGEKIVKPVVSIAKPLAPAIGAAIGGAVGGPAGVAIGGTIGSAAQRILGGDEEEQQLPEAAEGQNGILRPRIRSQVQDIGRRRVGAGGHGIRRVY
jgi:uncharacterized protein (DUF697 family)